MKWAWQCHHTSKTTKMSFQPTFVVTYTQLCSFSNDNMWVMQGFESTIFDEIVLKMKSFIVSGLCDLGTLFSLFVGIVVKIED
jgi:hypothetical protein